MSQRGRHSILAYCPRPHRRVALIAAVLVSTTLVGGCGNDDPDEPARGAGPSPSTRATADRGTAVPANPDYAALCTALDAALVGDVDAARAAFDHGPLHDLADAAIDVDRATAARLLEAKEAVESDLANMTRPTGDLADDLRTLVDATIAALTATGQPTLDLCEQETQ